MTVKCPKCDADNTSDSQFCKKCATPLPSPKEGFDSPTAEIGGHEPNSPEFSLVSPGLKTQTFQALIKELSTGSTFAGRYQVIEELGKGGMGRVYKVFDTKIKEKVALKLIRQEIASDKETIERFSNELRLARRIRHKNVCGMFDIGEAEGSHFITMEYVQGEDLKTMIRMAAGLSIGAVLSIGKQICDGLAEAHSLGVVHRDLKPQNIMIDKGGNAKIMDFGIARSVREKGITGPSVLIGTPEYMSPEQAEAKEVDQRSDIYSLGIILYEMATGRVPFEGDTALSIAMKHKGEIPKNPKELNPNIPDDLSGVILKCLDKDKGNRYQTAADVRSELENIEKGIATAERIIPEKKASPSKEITVAFGLKKAFLPILGLFFLAIAAVVIWRILPKKEAPPAAAAKKSIAVLPFEDLSQAKNNEYLCDGISETLINALTNIEGLWVPARTSAFFFKGKTQDIREIGQKLGVDNVLEGSVQVAGDNLRVTARISDIQDGRQIWSEIFNRKMADIFAIQDDIAKAIVTALKLKLLGEKEAPLIKNYTANLQAHNLYLQGRYFKNKRTAEDLKKAIALFNQAVEMDPHFARAYVGVADSSILLIQYASSRPEEVLPKARAVISKALEIDDQLAEAHTSLGKILEYERNWESAEKEYKRAIELNPNYATGHHWYAIFLGAVGRLDAELAEAERAFQLDPLSPIINTLLGSAFYNQREFDKAIRQCRKTLELDPDFAEGRRWLGICYRQKGMLKEAVSEFEKARVGFGESPYGLGDLGNAYALSGEKTKALEVLKKLEDFSRKGYSLNHDMAFVYCGLGDKDKAFERLERAFPEKEGEMLYSALDPAWDSLRSDPRFKALLKRMNL